MELKISRLVKILQYNQIEHVSMAPVRRVRKRTASCAVQNTGLSEPTIWFEIVRIDLQRNVCTFWTAFSHVRRFPNRKTAETLTSIAMHEAKRIEANRSPRSSLADDTDRLKSPNIFWSELSENILSMLKRGQEARRRKIQFAVMPRSFHLPQREITERRS